MNQFSSSAELYSALSKNVVPTVNKVGGLKTRAPFAFDPDGVNLFKSVSRWNSVIEISDKLCMRVVAAQFASGQHPFFFNIDLFEEEVSQGATFSSPGLNYVRRTLATGPYPSLAIELIPESLEYLDGHKVRLGYWVQMNLSYERNIVNRSVAVAPDPLVNPVAGVGVPEGVRAMNYRFNPASNTAKYDPNGFVQLEQTFIGACRLVIETTYVKELYPQLVSVDVWADLLHAAYSFDQFGSPDVKWLLDKGFLGDEGSMIVAFLNRKHRVKLTPTICLVGEANPHNVNVSEVKHFDVAVFPVAEPRLKVQALAIAVNIKQGCNGIIEHVAHFIGRNDYGVITDEYLIDKIFRFKWRIGGFKRVLDLLNEIAVKVNGNDETATLVGTMKLESLDVIALEVNSNTRQDGINIGGEATVRADRIILRDHSVVDANTPDTHVDFGDVVTSRWGLSVSQNLSYISNVDPQILLFEEQARKDAFRNLARPFAGYEEYFIHIVYVRTDGISKQVYYLADVKNVFL